MRRKPRYTAPPTREDIDEIFADSAPPRTAAAVTLGTAAAVPVRTQSNYYWNPFSLICGLCDAALPVHPSWASWFWSALQQKQRIQQLDGLG